MILITKHPLSKRHLACPRLELLVIWALSWEGGFILGPREEKIFVPGFLASATSSALFKPTLLFGRHFLVLFSVESCIVDEIRYQEECNGSQ